MMMNNRDAAPSRGRTTLEPPEGSRGPVDLRVSRIVFDSKRQDWQTIGTLRYSTARL